jgi:hypothetical protein
MTRAEPSCDHCIRGLAALVGIGAMLVALLTAPFFHFHDRDEHHASVVHAHFAELESGHHSDTEFEAGDSHHDARWVDFFTFGHGASGFDLSVDVTQTVAIPVPEEHRDFVASAVPQAHGPPGLDRSVPRSPPSL